MKDAAFSSARLLEFYNRISDAPDAIPRLRRFVLDLAVRGKLMEQDVSDEPAAELLKRIAQEKVRLVNAEEIKKGNAESEADESRIATMDEFFGGQATEIPQRDPETLEPVSSD